MQFKAPDNIIKFNLQIIFSDTCKQIQINTK